MAKSHRSMTVLQWLISLINPPPLHTLNRTQKVSRVLIFSVALITICILSSMLAAMGIFALQNLRHIFDGAVVLAGDLLIIFVSMLVNALCVMVLLKIKHADQKLIPPPEPPV